MAIPYRNIGAPSPVDWRNTIYQPQITKAQAPSVAEQTPSEAPAAGSQIAPVDTSGLYAIYGQKNPYSADAERYAQMAGRDMGGKLGQLPGIVATYLGAKASAKAQEFEENRQKKIDELLGKKKAWDKIKDDRAEQERQLKVFEDNIGPKVMQFYKEKYKKTENINLSGEESAKYANEEAKKAGLTAIPLFEKINGWDKGEVTMLWSNSEGKPVQGRIDKYGNIGKLNKDMKWVPADSNDMLLSAYDTIQKERLAREKSNASGLRGKEHIYLTDNNELITSTDPEKAKAQGATKVMMDVYDEDLGSKVSKTFPLPGMAKPETPAEQPAQPQPQQPGAIRQAAATVAKGVMPFSQQVASATQRAVGGQPAAQANPNRAKAEEILRANRKAVTPESIDFVMKQLGS